MRVFVVTVDKVLANITEKESITSHSQNAYVVQFNFTSEWQYLERTARFRAGDTVIDVLLDDTNRCMIPWEVMTKPKVSIDVGAYGVKDGDVVLPTVWATLPVLFESVLGVDDPSWPSAPSPSVYQYILARLGKLEGESGSGGSNDQGGNDSNVINRCVWFYEAGNDIGIFANGSTNVASPSEFIGHAPTVSTGNVGLILVDGKLYWTKFNITAANENSVTQLFTQNPILIGPANKELPTISNTTITNVSQLQNFNFPCCIHLINSNFGFEFNDDIAYVKRADSLIWVYTIDGVIANLEAGPDGQITAHNINNVATETYVDNKLKNIESTPGASAYEVAVENGFEGTEEEWLASLHGADGEQGNDGQNGFSPTIEVTEIDGGKRISITDVSGTQTTDIFDGEDGVKDLPTIKDTVVTNVSYFEENNISLPCCVHCVNSSIGFGFENEILYIDDRDQDDGFLYIEMINNATITLNVDTTTGAITPKNITRLGVRVKNLEDEIGNIGSILDAINGEVV